MNIISLRILLLIAILCVFNITNGNSQCLTAPSFNGNETIESFEGLTSGPNNTLNGPYLEPGVLSPFTFPSGVTYTNPIPNVGLLNGNAIADFSIGSATFGFFLNGFIGSAVDVPFGSAYFLENNPIPNSPPVEFTFATPMETVGFFYTGGDSGDLTLNAFDCNNVLLMTCTGPFVNVSNWGSNFIGVTSTQGICRIEVSGELFVLDNLTFEELITIDEIPTMGEWGLICLTLLFLICAVVKLKQTELDLSDATQLSKLG